VVRRPLASVDVTAMVFGTLTDVANVLPPADPMKEEKGSKEPRSDEAANLAPPVLEAPLVFEASSVGAPSRGLPGILDEVLDSGTSDAEGLEGPLVLARSGLESAEL